MSEEIGDEMVLIKDHDDRVIGFERLNYEMASVEAFQVDALTLQVSGHFNHFLLFVSSKFVHSD